MLFFTMWKTCKFYEWESNFTLVLNDFWFFLLLGPNVGDLNFEPLEFTSHAQVFVSGLTFLFKSILAALWKMTVRVRDRSSFFIEKVSNISWQVYLGGLNFKRWWFQTEIHFKWRQFCRAVPYCQSGTYFKLL